MLKVFWSKALGRYFAWGADDNFRDKRFVRARVPYRLTRLTVKYGAVRGGRRRCFLNRGRSHSASRLSEHKTKCVVLFRTRKTSSKPLTRVRNKVYLINRTDEANVARGLKYFKFRSPITSRTAFGRGPCNLIW